jgi:hypothetical protein
MAKKSDIQIIKETEANAKKNGFRWKCINPRAGISKSGNNLVIMKCLDSNRVSRLSRIDHIKEGHNIFKRSDEKSIFYFSDRTDETVCLSVNKIGKKHKHPFKCINPNAGYKVRPKSQQKHRLVEIQSLITKRKSLVELSNLKRGKNPFNDDFNRLEVLSVQPKYERLLKKLNIPYIKEFKMGQKSIDFMFIKNGKRYGLEVKQSEKWHSEKNQLEMYKRLGNLKPFKLDKVLLSDPKGKHKDKGSISLKDLEKFLK